MKKKTKVLIFSGVGAAVLVIWDVIGNFKLCGSVWGDCVDMLADVETMLLPIIPLFILSLITYKMREEVFGAWWKFARVFVPLSILAILIAPSYTHNWIFPIVKGTIALTSAVLFVIISLVLIVWQSVKERKRQ